MPWLIPLICGACQSMLLMVAVISLPLHVPFANYLLMAAPFSPFVGAYRRYLVCPRCEYEPG